MQRASRVILGISLLFFMAVLGLAVAALVRGHSDAVKRAESTATVAADAVAAHVQWLLEASSQTLRRVEEMTQRIADLDTGATMTAELERMAEDLPHGIDLALYGGGELIFPGSGDGGFPQRLEVDLFDNALDAGLGLSRFDAEIGGNGGFLVASPVELGSETAGLAVVLVPGDLFTDFWRRLSLGPDSAISIVRSDGLVVARHPVPDGPIDLSRHRLFVELLPRATEGIYNSPASPADGIARIVAYTTVPDLPLVAIAAISRSHALEPYWQRVWRVLALGIPVLLLLLALLWWQARILGQEVLAREALRQSAEHNRLLLREVHHRIKNNLQIIASLIKLQNLPSDKERDLRNRIMAMSALHEHLHGQGPAGQIELGGYLREIFQSVNGAFGDQISLELALQEGVQVDADVATPLGLIANELMTNANKYAYPEGPPGTMVVSLAAKGEGRAELAICNDGIPFDAQPQSGSEGIRLIRSLARQVNPEFVFDGLKGLEFRIAFKTLGDVPHEAASSGQ
jgi:two-component system, sensor histidine kinase PdtaS